MQIFIIFIIILIIVFLIARGFWCWYWKINVRINQIDTINENLEQIKKLLIHQNATQGKITIADGKNELPKL